MLSNLEQQQVAEAIAAAEQKTSGEIRVHMENLCTEDPMKRAIAVFEKLGMQRTAARNGVLIYVALQSNQLAIIGDKGINEQVPSDFWNSTRDLMIQHFQKGQITSGLCAAITEAGAQLAAYFPHDNNDQNELTNDISFG
ncbi:MAG: TPM domain-containing protein [Flavobacteriales bacterium]